MDTFVCVIGVSLVALCYVMFFALARKMLTKTEAAEEPGDEVLTIARDEVVTSAIAECIRQGEYDAAEKLAEVWEFNTTENLMNACNEMFDRETLKKNDSREWLFPCEEGTVKDKTLIDVCMLEEHKPLVALVTCAFSGKDGCEATGELCLVCPMHGTPSGCVPQAAFKKLVDLFNGR